MLKNTYRVDLDIKQQAPVPTGHTFISGDNSVNEFLIYIKSGSSVIDYSEVDHAIILFAKSDGTTVQGNLVLSTDHYTYQLGTNEIAAIGALAMSVCLYGSSNQRLTVSHFTATVAANPIPDNVVNSSTELDALSKAIVALSELEQKLADFPHIKILGTYPTLEALQAAYPNGAALDGGFFISSHYYAWSITTSSWVDIGELQGPKGYSTYEIAVQNGYVGTITEWIASLKGETGTTGATGPTGATPNITIGTVENLASGSTPYVTRRTGTPDTAPILDIGLVRGTDGTGAGDMLKATYDPNNKNADAFNMDNMVSGTTNKILTATAQTIAGEKTFTSGIAGLAVLANGTVGAFKTGIGPYSTMYYSTTYGARFLGFDGVNYYPTVLGALVNSKFNLTLNIDGTSTFGGDVTAPNLQPKLISCTTATATLTAPQSFNTYTMVITANTTFVLPTITDNTKHYEILINASFSSASLTIAWGTTYFFNGTAPTIAVGNYNIIYEWDNLMQHWVCGIIKKAVVG